MPGKRPRPRRRKQARAKSTRQYVVFLSHASRDNWLAGVIKERIEVSIPRVEVWLDEMSLRGGEEIIAALRRGISNADEAVVILSNESLRSQSVAWEIGMAAGRKKRITPLLNNVDYDAMAPLKGVKSYELNLFENFLLELESRAAGTK